MRTLNVIVFTVLALISETLLAAPSGLTVQGRLMKDNHAVSGGVTVTLTITSPNSDRCILFQENHSFTIPVEDGGAFNIGVGSGSRTASDKGFTLQNVFSNTGVAITGLSCPGGVATSYTPASSHSRHVYLSFNTSVGLVSFNDPYVVQSVPYAFEADKLAGKAAADFLQTVTSLESTPGTTQTRAARILDTDYNVLDELLAGTSSKYMTTSNTGPTKLPVLSSPPVAPSVGQIWYEGGVLKYYAGAAAGTKVLGTADGAVSSVATGAGLTGGPITQTGTIALESNVVTTGTYKSVTVDTHGRVTAGTNPTTTGDYGITDAVIKGGQAGALTIGTTDSNSLSLNTNNSAKVTVLSDGKVGIGTTGPGYPLEVNGSIVGTRAFATTGTLAAPGISFIGNTNSGLYMNATSSIALSNGGVKVFSIWGGNMEMGMPVHGAASYSGRLLHTSTSMTVPALTFRDATTMGVGGDGANGKLSLITGSTSRMAIDSTGKVGVGTTAPSGLFSVAGAATDNAYFFYDNTAVANGTDGQSLYLYRKGSTDSSVRLYIDQYREARFVADANVNHLRFETSSALSGIHLNTTSGGPVTMFNGVGAGKTPTLSIGGYRTGDSARRVMTVGISSTANDTANFAGVSNYTIAGNLGLNTDTTTYGLNIGDGTSKDSSIMALGYGTVGTDGTTLGVAGAGVRMFWYPKKAAFRSGRVTGVAWDDANVGNYSIAAGYDTRASGSSAVALGNGAVASGTTAIAIGNSVSASGSYAVAVGASSTSSGYASFASGASNAVSGTASAAVGQSISVSGSWAFSSGVSNNIQGNNASALGSNLFARGQSQVSIGQYNENTGTESASSWVLTDPLFQIGNGTSSGAKSNAMTVLKNGNVGIGVSAPANRLNVTESGGTTIAVFSNGTQTCSITPSAAGSVTCSSDERLKRNIQSVDDALSLENILKLNTVTYEWKSRNDGRHTGYIAQEIEKVAPEFVITGKDGYKQVSYVGFIPWITGAIKQLFNNSVEQDKKIAELEKKVQELESMKTYLCSQDPAAPICK